MCAAAATAGYNPCPGSSPQTITCPGGELIRSPNPHSDETVEHAFVIKTEAPGSVETYVSLLKSGMLNIHL